MTSDPSRPAPLGPGPMYWTVTAGSSLILTGVTLGVLLRVVGHWSGTDLDAASDAALSIGVLAGNAVFYHGLIHWNRVGDGVAQPGDRLNGIGAVLVLAAAGTLVADTLHRTPTGLDAMARLTSVMAWSSTIVILGTCLSVAALSRVGRDSRIWMFTACAGLLSVTETVALAVPGDGWPWRPLGWALDVVIVLVGHRLRRGAAQPARPATTQATTSGAIVVLIAAVAVLVGQEAAPVRNWGVTLFAAVSALAVSFRLIRLVADLDALARTRLEARTDELTGLANRRALLTDLDDAVREPGRDLALLLVDLDRFKAINDRFGHSVGDDLLRHVAGLFRAQVPAGGLLARLGGDEFAVLLPGTTLEAATVVAEALAGAATPVSDVGGRMLRVGASVGLAAARSGELDGVELLRRADTAMYRAKGRGDGVQVYDAELDRRAIAEQRLLEDLHLALAGDAPQIVAHFQPQLSTATGDVVGAEALVRWEHPTLGLLTPDRFVDLAEANGLIGALTTRVMRASAQEAARWRAAGRPLRVSVNLSASCLGAPALLPLVDEVLAGGLPAGDLVLEITESMIMDDPEVAMVTMRALAARGVGLSIDDYGTGYSSLSYLADLPAAELKIDRSFVVRLLEDTRIQAIVAGTVEMAHRLGLRIVAEGVETSELHSAVRWLGCDDSQGYLHSRPLAPEAFLAWIEVRGTAKVSV